MDILFIITTILFFAVLGYIASFYIIDSKQGNRFISDTFRKTVENKIDIESNQSRIEKLERQLNDLRNFVYATRNSTKRKDNKD